MEPLWWRWLGAHSLAADIATQLSGKQQHFMWCEWWWCSSPSAVWTAYVFPPPLASPASRGVVVVDRILRVEIRAAAAAGYVLKLLVASSSTLRNHLFIRRILAIPTQQQRSPGENVGVVRLRSIFPWHLGIDNTREEIVSLTTRYFRLYCSLRICLQSNRSLVTANSRFPTEATLTTPPRTAAAAVCSRLERLLLLLHKKWFRWKMVSSPGYFLLAASPAHDGVFCQERRTTLGWFCLKQRLPGRNEGSRWNWSV